MNQAVVWKSMLGVIGVTLILGMPGLTRAQGTSESGSCGLEYEQLKRDFEALQMDYKNISAQARELLSYKKKVLEMDEIFRKAGEEKDMQAKLKEAATKQIQELEERAQQQDKAIAALKAERDEYKKSFEKVMAENIIVDETKKKIDILEKENAEHRATIAELNEKINALNEQALKKESESEFYKRQSSEVQAKYDGARQQNKVLEQKLQDLPKKFSELARENKVLVKRTALMHYNLGVFYTQQREFPRAVAEFEKAVELNQEDGASFYNLGYIYAEHLQNRPKAIEYFRKYLSLAKSDDKDADWAKRYILTWQAWDGQTPIK